ncbi:MAG: DUF1013 domain-containing protein [Alphaproteobacteria bacterium]|nr:DUF1013 domain-containing protein [Alphaproteobacteria bacterium]
MPKATAVWLVDHTALTFQQIADFCGLHELEVKAIADGEVNVGIVGISPVQQGQLSDDEIKRCEQDPDTRLKISTHNLPLPQARSKGPRYTPVSKRADKPDGIMFLLKTYPELSDAQIAKLIGTTKDTITKLRDRQHWNIANIKPRDPLLLDLCNRADLDAALTIARRRAQRADTELAREMGSSVDLDDASSAPIVIEDEDTADEESGVIIGFGTPTDQPAQPDFDLGEQPFAEPLPEVEDDKG